MQIQEFVQKNSLENRQFKSFQLKLQFPDRVPIIIDSKYETHKKPRSRYLCPKDITFGEFIYLLRRNIHLHPKKSIFLMTYNTNILLSCTLLMENIFQDNMSEDGFLYLVYCEENAFG